VQEACRQAAAAGVPIWFEPVSVPKAARAAAVVASLTFVSPNEKELAAMADAVRQHKAPQAGLAAAEAGTPACACRDGGCSNGCCSGGGRQAGCCCSCCCCPGPASQAAQAAAAAPAAEGAGAAEVALQTMLPDIATLLLAGVRHVVLTMGPSGAALCTLVPDQRVIEGAQQRISCCSSAASPGSLFAKGASLRALRT
jgi:sugar/nucleoside kinase (ribokinase family)